MSEHFSQAITQLAERRRADEWQPHTAQIVVGKDILELLSSSMYVDPMTVYREYVQNAADAITDARRDGLLAQTAPGRVEIDIDAATRAIRLRDNGVGLEWPEFESRLLSFGASGKRGKNARGFRGVGRLAGLGYCQDLVFRSRAQGESRVSELRWDCRRLKFALRSADPDGGLADLVRDMVSVRRITADGFPERFFEVELKGIVRHRNDCLLSPAAVSEYLSQVSPVPFAPSFGFGPDIVNALRRHIEIDDLEITIAGADERVFRPMQDRFQIGENVFDSFTDVEIRELPGVDGGVAAVLWVLHHGYTGALPARTLLKGLRARCGNIQVGGEALFENLFPESRFNGWAVGEIHILDRRIVPNGRRDHFEQNVHFDNLLNGVAPIAREIARRCRASSVRRKSLRDFDIQAAAVRDKLGMISQGTLPAKIKDQFARDIKRSLAAIDKIAEAGKGDFERDPALRTKARKLRTKFERVVGTPAAGPLTKLPSQKRKMYEHLFGLIYECSTNRIAAKALVDRILLRIC